MKPGIIIIVQGGLVQNIISNGEVDVHLLDWDGLKDSDTPDPDLPPMHPDETLSAEAFEERLRTLRQEATQYLESRR
jgi:hypothetical protein